MMLLLMRKLQKLYLKKKNKTNLKKRMQTISTHYQRKIIDVEAKLGFLFVPAHVREHLPTQSQKIKVRFEQSNYEELTYNADCYRIFGLTAWYRSHNIEAGAFLDIRIENEQLQITRQQNTQDIVRDTEPIEENETNSESIDITNLSANAKGDIVEDRIKELILLYGQGMLNVYKPVNDIEGIDLIVLKNNQFQPIFLQIKSRFDAYSSKKLTITLKNFKAHHSYYVVGVSFHAQKLEVENKLFLFPSKKVEEKTNLLGRGQRQITTSMKSRSNDQWQEFAVTKEEFVNKLFEKFAEMEMYLR